jgi:excisionase family DNA binding protein
MPLKICTDFGAYMTPSFTKGRPQFSSLGSMSSGFYSVGEAAAMTKTGEETIRRAIREGRLPAFGTRGRLRVRLSDLMPQYVPRGNAPHSKRA